MAANIRGMNDEERRRFFALLHLHDITFKECRSNDACCRQLQGFVSYDKLFNVIENEDAILEECRLLFNRTPGERTQEFVEYVQRLLEEGTRVTVSRQVIAANKRRVFVTDFAYAYIHNCVEANVKLRRFNVRQLTTFGSVKIDLRYKMGKVHQFTKDLADKQPPELEQMRTGLATEFYLLSDLKRKSDDWAYTYLKNLLSDWLAQDIPQPLTFKWTRVAVMLMLTAEVVCATLNRNGFVIKSENRVQHLMRATVEVFYTDNMTEILYLTIWSQQPNIEGLGNGQLNLPQAELGQFRAEGTYDDIVEMVQSSYVPSDSEEYCGCCSRPVPLLTELAYNSLSDDAVAANGASVLAGADNFLKIAGLVHHRSIV